MIDSNTNIADYESARNFFADFGRQADGVSSIIEFGTTRAVGLSDIDIMIIVDSETSIENVFGRGYTNQYPESVRKVQDGGLPKIVTEEQFNQLPVLGEMNITPIYGTPVKQISVDSDTRQLILVADVMDWLAERIVTLNAHIRSNGSEATRAINCVYSISHTYRRAAEALAIDKKVSESFRGEVDTFRSDWKAAPNRMAQHLVPWLIDRLEDTRLLASHFGEYVEANGLYFPPADSDACTFRFNNGTVRFDLDRANDSHEELSVPGVWLAHFVLQSELSGLIPAELETRIEFASSFNRARVSPELRKLLTQRMELCNSIAGMLLPLGLWDNIYRFAHLLSSGRHAQEGHRN
jgi:hypothetical protein